MKPLAASVVISSGGSMSPRWLDGGGIVNAIGYLVLTGAKTISIDQVDAHRRNNSSRSPRAPTELVTPPP